MHESNIDRKLDLESTIVDTLIDDERVSIFSPYLMAAPVSVFQCDLSAMLAMTPNG